MSCTRLRPSLLSSVVTLFTLVFVLNSSACAYRAQSTQIGPPSKAQLHELWDASAARERRDLFYGSGGRALAPRQGARFTYVETDSSGASPGYTVLDAKGREWDVKLGPEAPVEVVVSRLVWAAGYHQLPAYYLAQWTLADGPKPGPQQAGRFRPKLPSVKFVDRWAWHENPFIGTRELRGLFVLMVLLNNWDLKTSQNAVYVSRSADHSQRRYSVVDLGAALGGTRWFFPGSKGDVDDYERERLIAGVRNGRVQFHYRGAWRVPVLDNDITVADVHWACSLLARLSDKQLGDAFRAGGYDPRLTSRFIRALRARIQEGLRLSTDSGGSRTLS